MKQIKKGTNRTPTLTLMDALGKEISVEQDLSLIQAAWNMIVPVCKMSLITNITYGYLFMKKQIAVMADENLRFSFPIRNKFHRNRD